MDVIILKYILNHHMYFFDFNIGIIIINMNQYF